MPSRKSAQGRRARGRPRLARRRRTGRGALDPAQRQRNLVAYGRMVLATEARALGDLRLDSSFATAVEWIRACKGQVVVTGIGKPGFVAEIF